MMRTPLRERARGRWHGILPALGIDGRYLNGKNGPCPLCPGGRDRWRFLNTGGSGSWICTHCGSGSGIELAMRFRGAPFKDVAQEIEAVIGQKPAPIAPPCARDESQTREALARLWNKAAPVHAGDPTDLWLRSRGIALDGHPSCLRTARIWYCDDSGNKSWHPAMLALVSAPDGSSTTCHRTYLAQDGRKAPVDKPRKLYSSMPKGSAVRLAAATDVLGIAEGIETALAASSLFKVPTWAAISAGMLEHFEPPSHIGRLLIFGDNDENHVGQRAAYALAARLSPRMHVKVHIPEQPASDWNDVLLGR